MTKKEENNEKNENIVKFSKAYDFEEKTIDSIDLSGIASLTTKDDAEVCQFIFSQKNRIVTVRTFDTDYIMMIVARATNMPIEFFYQLSLQDCNTLMNKARNFFIA